MTHPIPGPHLDHAASQPPAHGSSVTPTMWSVRLTNGVIFEFEAGSCAVDNYGHLRFVDGTIFARSEWSFVTPGTLARKTT